MKRYARELGEAGVMYSGYGLYKAGEFLGKVTSIPAKLSWALLFAETVIPAINSLWFHNQFIDGLHLNTIVPPWLNATAGGFAGVNAASNFTSRRIYSAFEKRGY